MKKAISFLVIIISLSTQAQVQKTDSVPPEKVYHLEFSETSINAVYRLLDFCKIALPASEAKGRDIQAALSEIAALQEFIVTRYKEQGTPVPKKK